MIYSILLSSTSLMQALGEQEDTPTYRKRLEQFSGRIKYEAGLALINKWSDIQKDFTEGRKKAAQPNQTTPAPVTSSQ